MIDLALFATLVAYSLVVSQPLAYLLFLTRAQRALTAPAYVELRLRINPVMIKRLPLVYGSALITVLLLLALALRGGEWGVFAAAAVALLCLVVDVVLMLRENVPINGVMDRWTPTAYPEDWEAYRAKWFTVFGYRQVALLAGLLALFAAAAFR